MAQKPSSTVPEEVKAAAMAAAEADGASAAANAPAVNVLEATAKANYVEFGSKRHERILSPAYGGLTREVAEQIIEERKKDPHLWPYEKYAQAVKFLSALDTPPGVTSNKPAWKREEV